MKTYTVYTKEKVQNTQSDIAEGPILYIPESFNFYAFLFNIMWLVYHRLWLPSSLAAIATILIIYGGQSGIVSSLFAQIALFGIHIIIGLMGNDLIRQRLEQEGFVCRDVIIASCEDEAEMRFICQNILERNVV